MYKKPSTEKSLSKSITKLIDIFQRIMISMIQFVANAVFICWFTIIFLYRSRIQILIKTNTINIITILQPSNFSVLSWLRFTIYLYVSIIKFTVDRVWISAVDDFILYLSLVNVSCKTFKFVFQLKTVCIMPACITWINYLMKESCFNWIVRNIKQSLTMKLLLW